MVPQIHLMCLIANGMYRNRLCSEPDLLAITLSLLPAQCSTVTMERIDQTYLSRLLQWCVSALLFRNFGKSVLCHVTKGTSPSEASVIYFRRKVKLLLNCNL